MQCIEIPVSGVVHSAVGNLSRRNIVRAVKPLVDLHQFLVRLHSDVVVLNGTTLVPQRSKHLIAEFSQNQLVVEYLQQCDVLPLLPSDSFKAFQMSSPHSATPVGNAELSLCNDDVWQARCKGMNLFVEARGSLRINGVAVGILRGIRGR